MTDVAKADWRYLTEEARKLEAERDDFKALVQRVHAECEPENRDPTNINMRWYCITCWREHENCDLIDHKPDCLWLAADELLRRVGAAAKPEEKRD